MKRITCFVLSLAAVVLFVGCGSQADAPAAADTTPAAAEAPATGAHGHGAEHHQEGGQTANANLVAPGEAQVGDTTTCPVSGETFVVSDSSPKAEHDGKTYYFCCAGCENRFAADPAKFLSTNE